MFLKRTLVAGAFAIASAVAANAADIPMAPAAPAPPAPPPIPVGVDWGGLYVGVLGDMQFVSTFSPFSLWAGVGARVGYNFDMGTFVVGVEGTVEYSRTLPGPWPGPIQAIEASVVARAGVEIAGGNALVFAVAGGGSLWNDLPIQAWFWTVGGGIEVMATDRLSIRTDYRYQGFPAFGPGLHSHNFSIGLDFHL